MKKPAPADLRRWSDEVARDPTSLAFLPLARAYRRQGQREAARQLCLRGLEHYPTHAEAHSLLALLYLEDGDRAKAADEWSMVLRIDPDHFESLRGIGFCYLEDDQLSRARQALERAALLRPHDATVQEALQVLGTRQELHAGTVTTNASPDDMDVQNRATSTGAGPVIAADPSFRDAWMSPAGADLVSPTSTGSRPAGTSPAQPAGAAFAAPASSADRARSLALDFADPMSVFNSLTATGPLLGVLLIDAHGLVLAGSMARGTPGSEDSLGAMLGPAIAEAGRTVAHLALGDWRGMLIEAGVAMLHVAPVRPGTYVVLAGRRTAPSGWMLRSAGQAQEIALRYLEEYA
ncbi:MAG TPA: tetratricopeptide repeat protein [Longimicrobiales bacterium]